MDSSASKTRNNIIFGVLLMGTTGASIGYFAHSLIIMAGAGALAAMIGGFVGWLGGRRFLLIICAGVLGGALLGDSAGDRDILIMAAGSGGAIAGFIGAQIERFL